MARELRDRFLEEVHSGRIVLDTSKAKYDVSRRLEAAPMRVVQVPLLNAA